MSTAQIARERKLLLEQGLELRTREEYGARQDYTSTRACDLVASAFFLHIAIVDDPSDLLGPEDQVARKIEEIGQARFGSGWSYNAAAFNTGRTYEGQPLHRRGTHTVNTYRRTSCETHGGSLRAPVTTAGFNNNVNARALVLPQQVDDPVTDEQIHAAARWAAAQKRAGLADPAARWHGHRCVTAKGCPGDIAFRRIFELQHLTDHYHENGLTDMITADDAKMIADLVWNTPTESDGRTPRKMLRQASKAAGLEDAIADRVAELLLDEPGDIAGTFDAEQIKAAVKQALREGTGD